MNGLDTQREAFDALLGLRLDKTGGVQLIEMTGQIAFLDPQPLSQLFHTQRR